MVAPIKPYPIFGFLDIDGSSKYDNVELMRKGWQKVKPIKAILGPTGVKSATASALTNAFARPNVCPRYFEALIKLAKRSSSASAFMLLSRGYRCSILITFEYPAMKSLLSQT